MPLSDDNLRTMLSEKLVTRSTFPNPTGNKLSADHTKPNESPISKVPQDLGADLTSSL